MKRSWKPCSNIYNAGSFGVIAACDKGYELIAWLLWAISHEALLSVASKLWIIEMTNNIVDNNTAHSFFFTLVLV